MNHYYTVPPSHYNKGFGTSPYSSDEFVPYQTRYDQTPTRKHSRNASYSTPKSSAWHPQAGSPPHYYEVNVENASPRKKVYVSTEKVKPNRHEAYTFPTSRSHARTTSRQNQPIYIYNDEAEYAETYPHVIYREPKSKSSRHTKKPDADSQYYRRQDQIYEEKPHTSRVRRSSTTKKSPQKSKPSQSSSHATENDAIRAGIPAGYSIKNWDPAELPIILLGSVFDANSLGKWIYDWTVYHHGASTPMADLAGELWLFLIKLAGKMKRAEECVRRIRSVDNQEMVEDFIVSGKRLWNKFKTLLKDCEYYMMKAAKKEGAKTMGRNAGTEFVDSIFGRDRYLEDTEKIMSNIRLWNMRFDVNCEDILRRPSAA